MLKPAPPETAAMKLARANEAAFERDKGDPRSSLYKGVQSTIAPDLPRPSQATRTAHPAQVADLFEKMKAERAKGHGGLIGATDAQLLKAAERLQAKGYVPDVAGFNEAQLKKLVSE
jgi:hypothetical protein